MRPGSDMGCGSWVRHRGWVGHGSDMGGGVMGLTWGVGHGSDMGWVGPGSDMGGGVSVKEKELWLDNVQEICRHITQTDFFRTHTCYDNTRHVRAM